MDRSEASDERVIRATIPQLVDSGSPQQYGRARMKCLRCGIDNGAGRRFCGACGAALQSLCASCGFANEPEARFCGGCGQPLDEGPQQSPHSYTPKHLVDRILTSRGAMEGERKQVSVMFCDLVDSSRLAAQLEPEAMHEVMDRVLRLMAEAVHRYEGTVNQFLGDGLMALFGAPIALEDHALRAVHAALAIHETVSGYGREVGRRAGCRSPVAARRQHRTGGRGAHRRRPAHGLHRHRRHDAPGGAPAGARRARQRARVRVHVPGRAGLRPHRGAGARR